jgi:hypothetical protein
MSCRCRRDPTRYRYAGRSLAGPSPSRSGQSFRHPVQYRRQTGVSPRSGSIDGTRLHKPDASTLRRQTGVWFSSDSPVMANLRPEPRASRTDCWPCLRNAKSRISLPATVTVSDGDQPVIALIDAAREVTRVCRDLSNSTTSFPASTRAVDCAPAAQKAIGRRTMAKRSIDGRISEV